MKMRKRKLAASLMALSLTVYAMPSGAQDLPPEVSEAPAAPAPLPDDAPDPREVEGGTLLPTPTDAEVLRIVSEWEVYPQRCQARLDAQAYLLRSRHKAQLDVCRADCAADAVDHEVQAASDWATWEVVLWSVGGGIVALGLGFGVGYASGALR